MDNDTLDVLDTNADAFAAFDIENVEVLDAADGTALPEMGASGSGFISTSSSSSSTCSAC